MWELWDATGRVRGGLDGVEARDLVQVNADPSVYARNTQSGATIQWDDVKDTTPTE